MPTWPLETTPSLNNPHLDTFASQIVPGGKALRLLRIKSPMPNGNCYWNAALTARRMGANGVRVADIALAAVLFCRRPPCRLGKPAGRSGGGDRAAAIRQARDHTVFLADESIQVSLEMQPVVDSHIMPLQPCAEVDNYVTILKQRGILKRNMARLQWELGDRCEANFALAARKKKFHANLRMPTSLANTLMFSLNLACDQADLACYESLMRLISLFLDVLM